MLAPECPGSASSGTRWLRDLVAVRQGRGQLARKACSRDLEDARLELSHVQGYCRHVSGVEQDPVRAVVIFVRHYGLSCPGLDIRGLR